MKQAPALLASMLVCLSLLMASAAPMVYADTPHTSQYTSTFFGDCSEAPPDANGISDGLTVNGENVILCTVRLAFNWVAIGVSTIVVIMVVVGAIQYTTAGGSQEQAKKAIDIIRNAILALVLYMLMWAFLNFLIPGGLFG